MTNGEFYDKVEQLGLLAVIFWRLLSEDKKRELSLILPDFSDLAEELEEYV